MYIHLERRDVYYVIVLRRNSENGERYGGVPVENKTYIETPVVESELKYRCRKIGYELDRVVGEDGATMVSRRASAAIYDAGQDERLHRRQR